MPYLLFQLAEDNDIAIEYVNFTHTNIDAMYIDIPGCYPVISLSKKLFDNRSSLRSVLAHEMGHYFTTAKSTVDLSTRSERVYLSHYDRIEMSRAEYRAWRWAANIMAGKGCLAKKGGKWHIVISILTAGKKTKKS
jgi:hypothetical protein